MKKLLLGCCLPVLAWAQWSDDPATNLLLSDRQDEQVQAKVVATPDGGAYVSWFDNADGGYDVYLQRLDVDGIAQWPANGVLVADRSYSSTQDYGLAIDSQGQALLAFRDDRGGSEHITAQKVATDGTLLWGTTGIQTNVGSGFLANPLITGTSDGQVVVAWTQDASVVVQKLDSAGLPQWGNGTVMSAAGTTLFSSDLQASDAGTAIVSLVESANFQSPKYLWAQKFAAADGAPLWGNDPLRVFDEAGGSLQFGNFPDFIADGAGGAVFSWYTTGPSLDVRVQRVNSAGVELFAHNGVSAATNVNQLRVSPVTIFQPSTESIFTFWVELSLSQAQSGIYAQKLDVNGLRQWTDDGLELVALDDNSRSFIQAALINDRAMVSWISSAGFNNGVIAGTQIDADGNFTWSPAVVTLNSNTAGDARLAGAASSAGFGLYAWTENTDVKAQNLNPDGTLGTDLIYADDFE
ncbi:hypothetical protein [Marinicella meishanensis]|uniref:hypothetical protein n=1 Tax=Marinicella meishanensis TaxID=2873263 RepID=UPI001CBCAFB1|nr:hypothetical protein [Marinicella sp. NBU2979]